MFYLKKRLISISRQWIKKIFIGLYVTVVGVGGLWEYVRGQ